MRLYNMVDASVPGAPLPKGTDILCAYIGDAHEPGAPDTPYIWTPGDCNRYVHPHGDLYRGPHIRIMPIYTKSYADDPISDGINALEAMSAYGWTMGKGRILWWDAELLIDEEYCNALALHCMRDGVRLGKYGSASTIEHDPPVPGGTWFAKWQKHRPPAIPRDYGDAWQWASPLQTGGSWDLTIATRFVYEHAGRGPRRITG